MTTVYLREDNHNRIRAFHRTPECHQLTKKPPKGEKRETLEVDLREVRRVVPCRTCYPDVPRVKVARRFCKICNTGSARPCVHNGGVPVIQRYATSYQSLFREPGDELTRTIYVWPDRAHLHYTTS